MNDSRLSRGHLRFLAAFEVGGGWMKFFLLIVPILVNVSWVIIYFVERTNDVFRQYGPCSVLNTTKSIYPTPFFMQSRQTTLWLVQVAFSICSLFVFIPFRYLRPGFFSLTRDTHLWFIQFVIDFITIFPFLFSLIFFPAYIAYVPSFLRSWIIKSEILFLFSKEKNAFGYDLASLILSIVASTLTIIGFFEWSQNNFPIVPVGTLPEGPPVYTCFNFFDSIYWFVITFATVGYGDAIPLNSISRLFVILSILSFLILLPEFVTRLGCSVMFWESTNSKSNRVTSLMHSVTDYQSIEFQKARVKRDHIVMDGNVTGAMAMQVAHMMQPKFFVDERLTSYVVILCNPKVSDELSAVQETKSDGYTRLFLLQGSLNSEIDIQRARSSNSKAIYILPTLLNKVQKARLAPGDNLKIREAMEQSRDYCIQRDYDTIRRIWGVQVKVPDDEVRIRCVLMHRSNIHLFENPFLDKDLSCRCQRFTSIYADSFEQRIAACSSVIPGFGTLFLNLLISGSCADKTFTEYELEAQAKQNDPKFVSNVSMGSGLNFRGNYSRDDEEYVYGFRNGIYKIKYTGTRAISMRKACHMAFQARVLLLVWVVEICSHDNLKPEHLQWAHDTAIKPGCSLICFGSSHKVELLSNTNFWENLNQSDIEEGLTSSERHTNFKGDAAGSFMYFPSNRRNLREGEHSHFIGDLYMTSARKPLRDIHLSDTRSFSDGGEEEDEIEDDNDFDKGIETVVRQSSLEDSEDGGEFTSLHPGKLPRAKLKDHIILSSSSHDSLVYFIRKLRSRDLENNAIPILIFSSHSPNKFLFTEISRFHEIYFLQGRSFIMDDLRRAGFENASCLVLLSDPRRTFETTDSRLVDVENLLAEKVANKLKTSLECNTRIVTHVSDQLNCEYIGSNRRFIDFSKTQKNDLHAWESQRILQSLSDLLKGVWAPILSASYISGESWSPSCYLSYFLSAEAKGDWVLSFFEGFVDVAGTYRGVSLKLVPSSIYLYEHAVELFLQEKNGLVIGVFRNYENSVNQCSRGVIIFPENDFQLTKQDRLFVLRGAIQEE